MDIVQVVLNYIVKYSGVAGLALALHTLIKNSLEKRPHLKFSDQIIYLDLDQKIVLLKMTCSNTGSLPLSIISVEYFLNQQWVVCSPVNVTNLPLALASYESKNHDFVFSFPSDDAQMRFQFDKKGDRKPDSNVKLKIKTSRGKRSVGFKLGAGQVLPLPRAMANCIPLKF